MIPKTHLYIVISNIRHNNEKGAIQWNRVHDQYRNEGLFRRGVCSNLAVMAMLPGAVLGQDELPNEVTWQKTQTSAQDPLPGHEGHQAAIVLPLPPKTDNC